MMIIGITSFALGSSITALCVGLIAYVGLRRRDQTIRDLRKNLRDQIFQKENLRRALDSANSAIRSQGERSLAA